MRTPANTRLVRIGLAFCLLLGGCSLLPKNDGVAPRTSGDDIDALRQKYHIVPLDPSSAKSLADQTMLQLAKTDPAHALRGTTYALDTHNRLRPGWLIATPQDWGMPATSVPFMPVDCQNCDPYLRLPLCHADADCPTGLCRRLDASVSRPGRAARKFCQGPSDVLVDDVYDIVVSARHAVDIALLQPPMDQRFRAGLRNAVTFLAHSGRAVTMRVIVGDYPPEGTDLAAFANDLSRDVGAVRGSHLRLYVGMIRSCNGEPSCGALSWNHAKIVAADGARALVGSHNFWSADQLDSQPVADLSMRVEGSAARDAHHFADALWSYVCSRPPQDPSNQALLFLPRKAIAPGCLQTIRLPALKKVVGHIRILSVGRLGAGLTPRFADQSLIARDLFLGAATKTLRFVQQDVAFSFTGTAADRIWPDTALERIVDLITERGGDAYIVLSNPGAKGPVGNYSNDIPLEAVAAKIKAVAVSKGMNDAALVKLLCQHLHLAPLRFGPDDSWPDGKPIGVHAKLWIVDDRAFYIGSENLYPVELQEFGYVVENAAATATVLHDYWDKVWAWSQRAAISGSEAKICVFAPKI
jgi:hypothetical protein